MNGTIKAQVEGGELLRQRMAAKVVQEEEKYGRQIGRRSGWGWETLVTYGPRVGQTVMGKGDAPW